MNNGDHTSLVTNPPTSDNGVTSTELTREDEHPLWPSLPFFDPEYGGCWCWDCDMQHVKAALDAGASNSIALFHRMNLCSDCGDKRCPRATDHAFACTSQPGSAASMNSGSRVVSSASPSTGDQQ